MQEEATQKTIALAKTAVGITGEILQNMIQTFLQRKAQGISGKKCSLRSLVKQGGKLSNFDIKAHSIKEFSQIAKKFHVSYSVMKDTQEGKLKNYIIFFRAEDVDRIDMAFKKYAEKKLKHKPSIIEKLEKAKQTMQQRAKTRIHIPKKEKGVDL